jgi:hypothetical protein
MKTSTYNMDRQNAVVYFGNVGVSDEAGDISKNADLLTQNFARTISFGDRLSRNIESLLKVKQEYSENNWDGYNAHSISSESLNDAMAFAMSLPTDIQLPEIDVAPSGQVVFTWSKGNRRTFSIIIGDQKELFFAGLFGARKVYGTEYLENIIPEKIHEYITEVFI